MGIPGAYLEIGRSEHGMRCAADRVQDFGEFTLDLPAEARRTQASRCMNCGVPFCQSGLAFNGARKTTGCPLHNLIPEINDLVCQGRLDEAAKRLLLTNPFPEFTSRVCPAPCEVACNLGLHDDPVTIHDNERTVADRYWELGDMGSTVAIWADAPLVSVVGSGPAGLAAAWELSRRGLRVRVYERDDRPGGLLMYGIPNMKLPKSIVERRAQVMREAGIEFICGVDAAVAAEKILRGSDAVILAIGSRTPRSVGVPGEDLAGVHFALEYLTEATHALLEDRPAEINAAGKDVVVIGGGDTGVDCVATALRQGAKSVRQVIRAARPPEVPPGHGKPSDLEGAFPPAGSCELGSWPSPRDVFSTGYGQQEAAELLGEDPRMWSCDTEAFVEEDGKVAAVRIVEKSMPRSPDFSDAERDIPAQLVLIAKGFVGPEAATLAAFGVEDAHSRVTAPKEDRCPVYLAGDVHLGSTIVASAMADALDAAEQIAKSLGA